MKLRAFLKYQFVHYSLRWRWLIPIPIGLCLGYWSVKVIQALTAAPIPSSFSGQGNGLEAFIWAFGKPEIVYFVISILWVFLISDIVPEDVFGQLALVRLGSRSAWWSGKVMQIGFSALFFGFLLVGSFFIPVLMEYPLSKEWSSMSRFDYGIGLGYSILNGSPVQAFWDILLFLMIGWFALGLLVLVVNLITQRSWIGFLCGAIVVVCGQLGEISGGPIGGSGLSSFFLLQNHLEFTPLWAPVRVIPEIYSWIFWLVWIIVCLAISFVISKNVGYFANSRQEE